MVHLVIFFILFVIFYFSCVTHDSFGILEFLKQTLNCEHFDLYLLWNKNLFYLITNHRLLEVMQRNPFVGSCPLGLLTIDQQRPSRQSTELNQMTSETNQNESTYPLFAFY